MKLSPETKNNIWSDWIKSHGTYTELAKKYNVSKQAISNVITEKLKSKKSLTV